MKETSTKGSAMYTLSKLLLNSLYGRFGLNPLLYTFLISSKKDMENKIKNELPSLEERIDFGDFSMCSFHSTKFASSNVAIASAITAYARIEMSVLKNRDDIKLFYTDTDSAYVNAPLDSTLISNTELGKFKLEHICSKGIFLAPKVYGLLTTEGNEIIKIKGLNKAGISNLSIASLEALLKQDETLSLSQERWFKKLQEGTITVKEQLYSLTVTGNKRVLIYNNGILVATNQWF